MSYLSAVIPATMDFQSVGTNSNSTPISAASWVTTSISNPTYVLFDGSFIDIGFQSPVVPARNFPESWIFWSLDSALANPAKANKLITAIIFFNIGNLLVLILIQTYLA